MGGRKSSCLIAYGRTNPPLMVLAATTFGRWAAGLSTERRICTCHSNDASAQCRGFGGWERCRSSRQSTLWSATTLQWSAICRTKTFRSERARPPLQSGAAFSRPEPKAGYGKQRLVHIRLTAPPVIPQTACKQSCRLVAYFTFILATAVHIPLPFTALQSAPPLAKHNFDFRRA